jgi:hypothetical protein
LDIVEKEHKKKRILRELVEGEKRIRSKEIHSQSRNVEDSCASRLFSKEKEKERKRKKVWFLTL